MKTIIKLILTVIFATTAISSQTYTKTYSLTVHVTDLKSSKGVVQFSLYNTNGTIPDEKFKKYYLQEKSKITGNSSTITFKNLPEGEYAVSILHDENQNGKIDKKWLYPTEGVGFSNMTSINLLNRPNFKKTKFKVEANKQIKIKIIYL